MSILASFGYHFPNRENKDYQTYKDLNIRNAVGYIPIVSAFTTAIPRIDYGADKVNDAAEAGNAKSADKDKVYGIIQVIRGTVELLGLGVIFLLFDVMITVGRALKIIYLRACEIDWTSKISKKNGVTHESI